MRRLPSPGDPDALTWAESVATALSGHILHILPGARPFYHAAAVMTSNYMAALLDSAEQPMVLAGVPKADAIQALAPIARTSLKAEQVEQALCDLEARPR
jgi:predicted short-subunit dehydrogenase-like oxidoreductase (DUF2520 family)